MFNHSQGPVEYILLRAHSNRGVQFAPVESQILVFEDHGSVGRLKLANDHLDCRGLACSIVTQKRVDFPAIHLHIELVDSLELIVIDFGQVLNL